MVMVDEQGRHNEQRQRRLDMSPASEADWRESVPAPRSKFAKQGLTCVVQAADQAIKVLL